MIVQDGFTALHGAAFRGHSSCTLSSGISRNINKQLATELSNELLDVHAHGTMPFESFEQLRRLKNPWLHIFVPFWEMMVICSGQRYSRIDAATLISVHLISIFYIVTTTFLIESTLFVRST